MCIHTHTHTHPKSLYFTHTHTHTHTPTPTHTPFLNHFISLPPGGDPAVMFGYVVPGLAFAEVVPLLAMGGALS